VASKTSEPSHDGAITDSFVAGSARHSDSSVRWMPPTRGGKSFVTMRVLGISTGPISSQRGAGDQGAAEALPVGEGGTGTGSTELDALETGGAFAALTGWRAIAVHGADARAWLHDLVTADVDGLRVGQSRRSLLLTPTGRIRADFHIAGMSDRSFLLLQATEQPEAADAILAPYVLSSDVELEDRSPRSVIIAVLGGTAAEDGDAGLVFAPSVLGLGHDVVLSSSEAAHRVFGRLRERGLIEVTAADVEAWRIRRGVARMGADFGPDALPAEAGLEGTIDFTKGCFLGQESVAKVRNLGHPPRVLLHVRSETVLRPGAPVLADGRAVGEVTSAAEGNGEMHALVRVRWDAASEPLSTAAGPLSLRRGQ
jgi:folate-binding protein YgfZ